MSFKEYLMESKLNIGDNLNTLLKKERINKTKFLMLAKTEEFTQKEIDDIDYMKDRIAVWRSNDIL